MREIQVQKLTKDNFGKYRGGIGLCHLIKQKNIWKKRDMLITS